MNSAIGIAGAFLLAIGGAILFVGLFEMSQSYVQAYGILNGYSPIGFGFVGFLFVGFGLWLIVQSGRVDAK